MSRHRRIGRRTGWGVFATAGVLAAAGPGFAQESREPDAQELQQYQQMLSLLDPGRLPGTHARLAAWCRGIQWTRMAVHHDRESARLTILDERSKLGDAPGAGKLKRLTEQAAKAELVAEWRNLREEWIRADIAERRKAWKPDDVPALRKILESTMKDGVSDAATKLAHDILEIAANDAATRACLGEVREGVEWLPADEAMVRRGGLKDLRVRLDLHRKLEPMCRSARLHVPFPYEGLERIEHLSDPSIPVNSAAPSPYAPYWKEKIPYGDGQGIQYIIPPKDYDPRRSWPVMVRLHNCTGEVTQERVVQSVALDYIRKDNAVPYVVLIPWARTYETNAWNFRETLCDLLDGIRSAGDRFRIDPKRVVLTGFGYGGTGVVRLAGMLPDGFSAFAPDRGIFGEEAPTADYGGKPFFVTYLEDGPDIDVVRKFLMSLRLGRAAVHEEPLSRLTVSSRSRATREDLLKFLEKQVNPVPPDLGILRRVVRESAEPMPVLEIVK